MIIDQAAATPTPDRRVRRTRAALIRAALTLVSERGTAAVPISDLADAADVSRQVVYQHFGDRDALLLAAAIDLARRELIPVFATDPFTADPLATDPLTADPLTADPLTAGPLTADPLTADPLAAGPFAAGHGLVGGRAPALAMARHFAGHRAFYRALLTGSCAFALTRGLSELMLPVNRQALRHLRGDDLDPGTVDDLAAFLTGGGAAFFNAWVVDGPDPLDPEEFTDRLMRMVAVAAVPVVAVPVAAVPVVAVSEEFR